MSAEHRWAFHAAIVVRGGSVVSSGFNHGWVHAERSALQTLWPSKRRGTGLWSVRVTRSGKLASAKPCSDCMTYLRENGVKSLWFTTQFGTVERMRL